MTRREIVSWLAALAVGGNSRTLLACGDKFLVTTRGTRFQRAGFVRQAATILLYANPASQLASTITALALPGALSGVGYTPTVVTGADALTRAMRDGGWDLVLVDLADSGAVAPPVPGAVRPAVVAVAYDVTGDVLKQARRTHDGVIRKPGRPRAVVDAIDQALFERMRRTATSTRAGN